MKKNTSTKYRNIVIGDDVARNYFSIVHRRHTNESRSPTQTDGNNKNKNLPQEYSRSIQNGTDRKSITYRSRNNPERNCVKSVRHSSRCQSLPADRTTGGRTWDRKLAAPWTDRAKSNKRKNKTKPPPKKKIKNGKIKDATLKTTINRMNKWRLDRFIVLERGRGRPMMMMMKRTFRTSSSEWISGERPPWTQRNCWFIRAASGRQSNASMQAS